tara:strand:+ start:285 stop:572 length:288 start_codon:yes stop_codon:yes gene_type:complete
MDREYDIISIVFVVLALFAPPLLLVLSSLLLPLPLLPLFLPSSPLDADNKIRRSTSPSYLHFLTKYITNNIGKTTNSVHCVVVFTVPCVNTAPEK